MEITPSLAVHSPWDAVLLVAAIVGAVATLIRLVAIPAWRGWRRVAATWERIEASVVKTEAQTNGALDVRFRSVETGLSAIHARLDQLETKVSALITLRPPDARTRRTDGTHHDIV
jgi:hypothetical protein